MVSVKDHRHLPFPTVSRSKRRKEAVLLVTLFVLCIDFTDSIMQRIDCYSCTNQTTLNECHNIVVCSGQSPFCFTTKNPAGDYTLGCVNETTPGKQCQDYMTTTKPPTTTTTIPTTTSSAPITTVISSAATGNTTVAIKTTGGTNATNTTNVSSTGMPQPSIVGRSVENDDPTETTLCCNKDACNKRLHPVLATDCEDVNDGCAALNSSFGICNKPHEAKDICKLTCNLCNYTDGAWSSWSEWSCGVTCGNGTETRTRTCTNPAPLDGGLNCTGDSTETGECSEIYCPNDGNWGDWMAWSECSATCGVGLRRRDRNCTNPRPDADGLFCLGDSRDDEICVSNTSCTDGDWDEWESWSACSATCGMGLKTRTRNCSDIFCMGETQQSELCFSDQMFCGERNWTTWSGWGDCTVTCGIGLQFRERSCPSATELFEKPCPGDSKEFQLCKQKHCPDQESAFYVTGSPTTGPTNGSIVLPDVITDVGGDYDNTSGTFTCRISGLYNFFVSLEKEVDVAQAYCHLLLNNITSALQIRSQSSSIGGTGMLQQATNSAVLKLSVGDRLHLGVCSKPETMTEYSTFSGNLITSEELN